MGLTIFAPSGKRYRAPVGAHHTDVRAIQEENETNSRHAASCK